MDTKEQEQRRVEAGCSSVADGIDHIEVGVEVWVQDLQVVG